MAKDLLLEIGAEEIPAKFMDDALAQLRSEAEKLFSTKNISYSDINTYGTPRRLVIYVNNLEEMQKDINEKVKGPSEKASFDQEKNPTKALLGFATGQGVMLEDISVDETPSGRYVFAIKKLKGKPTQEVLKEALPEIITHIKFPKSMRWADLDLRFARPLKWIVALFGEEVIGFNIGDIESGRYTYGHRFLSSGPKEIKKPEDYFGIMRNEWVMVDHKEREQLIKDQCHKVAEELRGKVIIEEDLLNEVKYLVEWPTAFWGSFEESNLELPKEAVITPMKEHLRYFPVLDNNNKLMARFIAIKNGDDSNLDIIRKGNERVLRARLADARFFFEEDIRIPLEGHVEKLNKVVFQETLGTMYEKSQRVRKLATKIADTMELGNDIKAIVDRSAVLCKADLVTGMVFEFTELQGIMGREYALKAGETPDVAKAIFEHYLPRFSGDILPETMAGSILSISDKLDSIVGYFGIGIQPTGSQDPFALRRQALGILNIIIENQLKLSLSKMVRYQLDVLEEEKRLKEDYEKVIKNIMDFFFFCFKIMMQDRGFRYDIIDGVLAARFDDILDGVKRLEEVTEFIHNSAFEGLKMGFGRVANLASKGKITEVREELFETQEEKELYKAFTLVDSNVRELVKEQNYKNALVKISTLREPIDRFFDSVMVMVEQEKIKNNRLALLINLRDTMNQIADFSKIQ
jgi:glycyl-tRNA synthetase beta chain